MSGNGIRDLSSLDRVIHEPARLMIMTILFAVKEADLCLDGALSLLRYLRANPDAQQQS